MLVHIKARLQPLLNRVVEVLQAPTLYADAINYCSTEQTHAEVLSCCTQICMKAIAYMPRA